VKVLRYPAIAEHDEPHRRKGEALFPEHKPLDFLYERKKLLTQPSWESIYQQHPIVVGGGQFPIEKMKVLAVFDRSKITHTIRYYDKAGTDASENKDAAFTAGVRMHAMSDGTFVISHVMRGQWSALERETKIKAWAEADEAEFPGHEIYVEQEPGSGERKVLRARSEIFQAIVSTPTR
jgi:phage terminase large subunit-like protein